MKYYTEKMFVLAIILLLFSNITEVRESGLYCDEIETEVLLTQDISPWKCAQFNALGTFRFSSGTRLFSHCIMF